MYSYMYVHFNFKCIYIYIYIIYIIKSRFFQIYMKRHKRICMYMHMTLICIHVKIARHD